MFPGLAEALSCVRHLEATVGISLAEVKEKEAMKAELDRALRPFRILAAAWSGGVMLGPEKCDDYGYAELLKFVAETGDLPDDLSTPTCAREAEVEGIATKDERGAVEDEEARDKGRLLAMVANGLGVAEISPGREALYALLGFGRCVPALSYDLAFPEVFYPTGVPHGREGFDAVLGNPPWDKLRVERRDIMASIDPQFMAGKESAGSGQEHELIRLAFQKYPEAHWQVLSVSGIKRCFPHCAAHATNAGDVLSAAGDVEQYRLFLVLAAALAAKSGSLGFVVGGGFAKNPADGPARRFVFGQFCVRIFAHYLNLRQLFDGASSRVSFVLIAGRRAALPGATRLAFDLTRFEDVLPSADKNELLTSVSPEKIQNQLNLNADLTILLQQQDLTTTAGEAIAAMERIGVIVSNDLHRTSAKPALHQLDDLLPGFQDARQADVIAALVAKGFACSYDGRSFDQFNSLPSEKAGKWFPQVTLAANLRHPLLSKLHSRVRFFRLAWRATCGHPKTNERSARACILPPGVVAANSILVEAIPASRPNGHALLACAIVDSFVLDSQLRPVVSSNLNKAIMSMACWPVMSECANVFLAHQTLRLISNSSSFAPLWCEQVVNAWREEGKPQLTWPVLAGDDERWAVRAAIDAVVADAYGLSRDQYAHVLSTFRHASYKKAPELCLARFDELKQIGLDAFTRKHDPYWDIPLNENLPKAVIELPIPKDETAEQTDDGHWKERSGQISFLSPGPLFDQAAEKPARRGRRRR